MARNTKQIEVGSIVTIKGSPHIKLVVEALGLQASVVFFNPITGNLMKATVYTQALQLVR